MLKHFSLWELEALVMRINYQPWLIFNVLDQIPNWQNWLTPVAFGQLLPSANTITHTPLQNRGMLITKNRLIILYTFHICILYIYWRGLFYIFLTICEFAMSFKTQVATFTSHFLNWWDSALHWTSSMKDFLTYKVLAVLKDMKP